MNTVSLQPTIRLRQDIEPFYFEEGCYIEESWNSTEDADCSLARARVPAGGQTRWHVLDGVTERYVMLAGEGLVEVGDLPPTRVGPGDVVIIPPGVRQRIEAVGESDLEFLAICTPRFRPECYTDVED